MRRLIVLFILVLCSAAQAVDYPIVYVEQPRTGKEPRLPNPWPWHQGDARLMIRQPDGSKEVLYDPGPGKAVGEPQPDLACDWVYFYLLHGNKDATGINPNRPRQGSDIYKINLATKELVRLTSQEAETPPGQPERLPGSFWGVFNVGPCPVPGGRVVFCSDREAPGRFQLYVMDDDGKNVERTGHLNLMGALSPILASDGKIYWSSQEGQGRRDPQDWGLWNSYPDGRNWNPFFSAFRASHVWHFAAEVRSSAAVGSDDGTPMMASAIYYPGNFGSGELFAAPLDPGTPAFEHIGTPPFGGTLSWNHFARVGRVTVTPWTTGADRSAPLGEDGVTRVGKLTHPASVPKDGWMLCTYSSGPVTDMARPTTQPWPDFGIYLCPVAQTSGPGELVEVVNDPAVDEYFPRALLPFAEIHGAEPVVHQWLPEPTHPMLPPGAPYAIIGTSSVYARESASMGTHQGGDFSPFANSEIHAIRILSMEMPPEYKELYTPDRTALRGSEKLRILGEIPLRKFTPEGEPILDSQGNPDTSFVARVPADVPFTFQLIDDKGRSLTTSQTWHQVRPGEVRTDCRGCHDHTQPGPVFAESAAGQPGFPIADLIGVEPRTREWSRDIAPIFAAHQMTTLEDPAGVQPPVDLVNWFPRQSSGWAYLQSIAGWAMSYDSRGSRLLETLEQQGQLSSDELRTVAEWIDTGMMRGSDVDNLRPTLHLDSPRREIDAPLAQVVVGAYDFHLVPSSLTATLNGVPVDLEPIGNDTYTATLSEPVTEGELTVSVADQQGNTTRIVRTFAMAVPPTDPCDALEQEVARLEAENAALRVKIDAAKAKADELQATLE